MSVDTYLKWLGLAVITAMGAGVVLAIVIFFYEMIKSMA